MATSVSVLAPNGRRQTVKCTANTTILQILEEVCRKQGFKAEEYDIKHHNKVLDTTISVRFSGLPNNAQLELATAIKQRVDSEIVLAVSLEDGNRVIGNFLPSEDLYSVLLKLCPNDVHFDKNPVIIYMRNEIYGPKLEQTSLKSLGLTGGRAMMRLVHRNPNELNTQANVSAPLPVKPTEEKPYHRTLIKCESDSNQVTVEEKPTEVKKTQQKNEIDLLKIAKDREKRKFESPVKTSEANTPSPRTKAKIEEPMEVDEAQDVGRKIEENFVFLGERQAMLFSLESAKSLPTEDLPDDFFELTIDDAKKILGDIRRKKHDMENGTLMTSAMRHLEETKKQLRHLHKYKQSVIRVQFGDKAILQGSFKPTETISDVKSFVKNYLQNANDDFYLYTTPPKSVLNEEDHLVEIGCVPGALLHIGSLNENRTIHLKPELKDKFTTNSLASLAATKVRAESTRSDDALKNPNDDFSSIDNDINEPGPSTQPTSFERKVIKSTEKVPKWFKTSK